MQTQIRDLISAAVSVLRPPPRLSVSEWSDKYRVLSPESSSIPGKWVTALAEFQRGIMDAITEPGIETVVAMTSSQVGKTEVINNVVGYIISQDPSPILVVQPTDTMGQTWSKDRFSPMVRDTEILHGLIKPAKSRDSHNTIMHKAFPGGHITVAGANSPASLASRPIRVVLCDEIDRYPPSAGSEGDPVSLAIKRSTTYWNRIIILTSTPTIKGLSRIEAAFEESDQRRFFVPCPHCGQMQYLKWAQVKWERDEQGNHLPHTAKYQCEKCSKPWSEIQRINAIRKGEWRATVKKPNNEKIAGFHIWEAYSPWVPLSEIVDNFLASKISPERLKAFVNTSLGETWEDEGLKVDDLELYARREQYAAQVPDGAMLLTCGVDVQDDRLEGEVVAWGSGYESWGIFYFIITGNPAGPQIWQRLDERLDETFEHESGINLRISCTAIDSGGHYTDEVYRFCKPRQTRRIFATKGANTVGAPLVSRPSKNNKYKVLLYMVGTDTAKELIFGRLKIEDPGPGFMHFPEHYDQEYFEQLTAEKAVTKYRKGFPHRVWTKIRARNEALDIRVGNLAALAILNPNFEAIEKNFEKIKKSSSDDEKEKKPQTRPRTRSNKWANGWRK